jgi:L-lactate dehydrogenase complex protein LldE
MIKEYYPQLFEKDKKYELLVKDLINKTYEFTQFLVDVLKVSILHNEHIQNSQGFILG